MQKSLKKFSVLMMAALVAMGMQSCKLEGPDQDDVVKYQATINNRDVNPKTTSSAQGSGAFEYNKTNRTLTYNITYQGLTPRAVSIHRSEPAWENGPIVFELTNITSSPLTGSKILTNEQETDLRLGRMYVLIPTIQNTFGEIRGQIKPVPINEP